MTIGNPNRQLTRGSNTLKLVDLAIGTHIFSIKSPEASTTLAVSSASGTADIEYTYDPDNILDDSVAAPNTDWAAGIIARAWSTGATADGQETIRGPITGIKVTVAVAPATVIVSPPPRRKKGLKAVRRNALDDFILRNDPVAYYRMDENNGTNMVNAIPGGSDGTYADALVGQAPVTRPPGKSAFFDGTVGSKATMAPAGIMDVASSVSPKTISCWFNTTDTVGPIMTTRNPSNPLIGIYLGNSGGPDPEDGHIFTIMRDNFGLGLSFMKSPLAYNDGNDHMVAMVLQATTKLQTLYIDGLEVDSNTHILTVGINSGTPQLAEDGNSNGGSPHFSFAGRIDNAVIYDVELDANDIFRQWSAGRK